MILRICCLLELQSMSPMSRVALCAMLGKIALTASACYNWPVAGLPLGISSGMARRLQSCCR